MTFTEFIKTHDNLSGKELSSVASGKTFDPEVLSFGNFTKLYHRAVRLGLTPDNAAEVFMKRFNVDFDFNKDAAEAGLSVSDWACKEDPFSYWYSSFWNDVADGKLDLKNVFSTIAANKEEVTRKKLSKNYNPATDTYVTDSGVTISPCRITEADLKKYRMPSFVEEEDD